MPKPPTKAALRNADLAKLCYGQHQWIMPLREVVTRWRTTKYEDTSGYPIVRMKLATWAEILGAQERTVRSWFSGMAKAGVVHTRKVRAKVGTGFVVAPSLEVQIAFRTYIAEAGRKPKPVPIELIAGVHHERLHASKRDYMALARHQHKLILANPDLVEGGEFYKVSGPVLHKLPKGTGDWKTGLGTTGSETSKSAVSLETAKPAGSSVGIYTSYISLPKTIKQKTKSLSTPGKPGAEAPAFGEGKGSVSGGVCPKPIPDSDSEFLPTTPQATVLDSSPGFCVGAKPTNQEGPMKIEDVIAAKGKGAVVNGKATAAPDSLSGLKPVFDDTAWQKGLAKTWRDTMVEAGHKPLMLGAAEIAMLKKALVFVPPKEKLEALAFVIRHWGKFRSYISTKFAVYEKTIPTVPTPQKLVYNRSYFQAFWSDRAEIVGKAAAKGGAVKKDYATMDEGMALLAKIKGEKK